MFWNRGGQMLWGNVIFPSYPISVSSLKNYSSFHTQFNDSSCAILFQVGIDCRKIKTLICIKTRSSLLPCYLNLQPFKKLPRAMTVEPNRKSET